MNLYRKAAPTHIYPPPPDGGTYRGEPSFQMQPHQYAASFGQYPSYYVTPQDLALSGGRFYQPPAVVGYPGGGVYGGHDSHPLYQHPSAIYHNLWPTTLQPQPPPQHRQYSGTNMEGQQKIPDELFRDPSTISTRDHPQQQQQHHSVHPQHRQQQQQHQQQQLQMQSTQAGEVHSRGPPKSSSSELSQHVEHAHSQHPAIASTNLASAPDSSANFRPSSSGALLSSVPMQPLSVVTKPTPPASEAFFMPLDENSPKSSVRAVRTKVHNPLNNAKGVMGEGVAMSGAGGTKGETETCAAVQGVTSEGEVVSIRSATSTQIRTDMLAFFDAAVPTVQLAPGDLLGAPSVGFIIGEDESSQDNVRKHLLLFSLSLLLF